MTVARIVAESAKVYRCPSTRRRYFTKRAAYASHAKQLILAQCNCEPDVGWECGMHRDLFRAKAWACDRCNTPDSDTAGAACLTCEQHGRCTVATTISSSDRYQRLKRRLTRWLMWLDARAT